MNAGTHEPLSARTLLMVQFYFNGLFNYLNNSECDPVLVNSKSSTE
jgi:hypothetical protein